MTNPPKQKTQPTGLVQKIRKNLSKTFDIIFICLSLLVILILITTGYNYQHNSEAIHHLSEELINQVNKRIITKTTNYFFKAVDMTALSSEVSGKGVENLLSNPSLEKLMLAVLKTHPRLNMFNIGNEKGEFLMQIRRSDGTIDMKKIYGRGEKRKVYITDRNKFGSVVGKYSLPETFDPRKRPWYIGAKEDQHTHWSNVYIFHTGKIPGITVSYPVIRQKRLLGVFALDIPLKAISQFLTELVDDLKSRKRITHATAFILNDKGEVIAYPYNESKQATSTKDGKIKIKTIYELEDSVIVKSYKKYLHQQGTEKRTVFTLQDSGHDYVASYSQFVNNAENGKQWTVGLVVREDDFISEIKETNHFLLTTSVAIIAFVMCLAFVLSIVKKELKKKNEFIQATFGRYLSDEIVENILESPEGTSLGGEKREVTILMTDLRGFTSISEKLPAETCVHMINIYLDVMTDIILKYHGTIDEFIGDAILTIFGAPEKREDDAKRAVACALEMQLAMDEVNRKNREAGYPEVKMGIGINTGELVVGNIGSSKRTKYGVVGSNVNLTSRIESYTVGGQILISESTLSACDGLIRVDSDMKVKPKGVKEPITIYEVGGIGGTYNVFFPEPQEIILNPFPTAFPFKFTVLSGKHAGDTWHNANIHKFAESIAEISSPIVLEHLSNLQIEFLDKEGTSVLDEIYAKVTQEGEKTARIHFTASPCKLEEWFHEHFQDIPQEVENTLVLDTLPIEE
ncbi:MAG: adenylate/guanylate cyclase domain-containing protein [Spirochaetota bacterium]